MKTKELIEALEAYDPESEVSLTFWNGEGSEVAPVIFVADNNNTPSIYADEWDGPSLNAECTENTNDDPLPAGVGAMTGSAFWVLFQHMSQNHELTLLDSELSDICHAVDRMKEKWKADEAKRRCCTCWGSGQVEIQSGPYSRACDACGGSGQNNQRQATASTQL